eukprot:3762473-Pyramimonas_sp.AAC.1
MVERPRGRKTPGPCFVGRLARLPQTSHGPIGLSGAARRVRFRLRLPKKTSVAGGDSRRNRSERQGVSHDDHLKEKAKAEVKLAEAAGIHRAKAKSDGETQRMPT